MNDGAAARHTAISVGGISVRVHSRDAVFMQMLEKRFAGFIGMAETFDYEFVVDIVPAPDESTDEDVRVFRCGERWMLERGDFRAEWDPVSRKGRIRQSANPYSIDTVLRIVHTLVLAGEGGFLVHASSVVRNGRAFLFAGASGAGKTTISRLAPPDVDLLTDEISYVRREAAGYYAYGTPFAGDLAKPGENIRAPLAAVYLLSQGKENRIDAVGLVDAARGILSNVLFFAEDAPLVQQVFQSALEFTRRIPVQRLTFLPTERVWELVS